MLFTILADSALETLPKEVWGHPLVVKHSKRRGRHPSSILLDRSYHHEVMRRFEDAEKRGRPDIIHFALLEALDSPLNREGLLRIYVHTIGDKVITIEAQTRLPRNYNRFVGLIEQLFEYGQVPPQGETLLRMEDKNLSKLLEELSPSRTVAFSSSGVPSTIRDAIYKLKDDENPAVIIGGFPRGSFREEVIRLFEENYSIDREALSASTVLSRVIYEYEVLLSLPKKRSQSLLENE